MSMDSLLTHSQWLALAALSALVILWRRRPRRASSSSVTIDHDGNVLMEWQAENYRVGLCFGQKVNDSGWYLVSKKEIGAEACEPFSKMSVEKFAEALKLVGVVK